MRRYLLIASLCLGAFTARAEDDDRHTRLDKGEAIVETKPFKDSSVPEAILSAVVDAPPERIWKIVTDCNNFYKNMVRIKMSKELSRDGNTVRCETTFDSPWPLSPLHAITIAHLTSGPDKWIREWKLESGDYKDNQGQWIITQWAPGRSLIEYHIHSEPKSGVPSSFQKLGLKIALPGLADKLREDVKQP